MAAHRYWALQVTARAGAGNGVSLAEVEMRASVGGADQCSGGTAGGAYSIGQAPANAFDNSDSTLWYNGSTSGLGVLLTYDFGSAVTVAEVFVRNAAASGSGSGFPGATYGPATCWVAWSDDGSAWHFTTPPVDLSGLGNGASATIAVVDAPTVGTRAGGALRAGSGWPAGPVGGRVDTNALRYDTADSGPFRVAGIVDIDGTPATPVRRRVRLFHRLSGRLVREVWSAADGTFEFTKLAQAEYVVMSDDFTRAYNAVVADAVTPVV